MVLLHLLHGQTET